MRKRPWFWRLTLLSTIIALLIGLILMRAAAQDELSMLHRDVATYRSLGAAIRLLLIGALAISWPHIVTAAEKRGAIHEKTAAGLCDARWRLLTWMLAAELLIGGDVLNVIATGQAS